MNRTTAGCRLTGDNMADIAVTHGCCTAADVTTARAVHDHKGAFDTHMDTMTAAVRFAMFCAGDLDLDTRPGPPIPMPMLTVCAEIVVFVTRDRVRG